VQKKISANKKNNLISFSPPNCTKLSEKNMGWIGDPGSEVKDSEKTFSASGSRGKKAQKHGSGSATLDNCVQKKTLP